SLVTKTSGNSLLSQFTSIVANGAGDPTSVTASIPAATSYGGLTAYQYSTRSELTQEQSARSGGYTNVFAYDPAQNPTTFKGIANVFNVDNQDTANVFDNNGNPTLYRGTAMTYDPENRLTAAGALLTAGYRGDGLRAWKQGTGA